ncbi:MAG: helix-turn-helix transcriptional regulator [Lachnospiraceae bacterium]|nr:helix-turn-helix transcriptional regulator [Lachnospiraceae bacterium]
MKKEGLTRKNEYEIVNYNAGNFHVFLVNLLYRTPHTHKDFEIGLILNGEVTMKLPGLYSRKLIKNDIFVLNPYQSHEFAATEPSTVLSLQVHPSFFANFFPKINQVEFTKHAILYSDEKKLCEDLYGILTNLGMEYFKKEELSTLKCASLVNSLFYTLLDNLPNVISSENENNDARIKGQRMRRLIRYIEEHYSEKILLKDLAERENLDLYYLSHFFTENFGIPFQKYLALLRCEKARSLLLLTDLPLLDISLSLGFSDPKYFNRYFKESYGCSPKEYRVKFSTMDLRDQQFSMLTTQKFMSDEAGKVFLSKLVSDTDSQKP